MAENKKGTYVVARSGLAALANGATSPYLYLLEGGLTRDPEEKTGASGKPFEVGSIGLRAPNAGAIWSRAGVSGIIDTEYVDITAFGVMKNALAGMKKGQRAIFGGVAQAQRNAADRPALKLDYCLEKTPGKIPTSFGHPVSVYGNGRRQMVVCGGKIVAGKNGVVKTTKTVRGQPMTSLQFSMRTGLPADKMQAIIDGDYDSTASYDDWFVTCEVIGPIADRLEAQLVPGAIIIVYGQWECTQGKTRMLRKITVWSEGGEVILNGHDAQDGNSAAEKTEEKPAEEPKKATKKAAAKKAPDPEPDPEPEAPTADDFDEEEEDLPF